MESLNKNKKKKNTRMADSLKKREREKIKHLVGKFCAHQFPDVFCFFPPHDRFFIQKMETQVN